MRGAFSHSIEIAKEWNKLKELKKGIKKYPIEQWQASHSKDVESGTNYWSGEESEMKYLGQKIEHVWSYASLVKVCYK